MVPLDARQQLWAWYYGRRAFEHCRACCEHVLRENLEELHPLYYPLNVGATINYGRPFRKSYGMPTLPEAIVPARYRLAHEKVMLLRDKLHAHTDVMGTACPGQMAVDVLFEVTPRDKGFKILEAPMKLEAFRNLDSLCNVLIEKATYHLEKLFRRHEKEMPHEIGEYRIGITPNVPEFLRLS